MQASPTIVAQLTDPHIPPPGRLLAGRIDTPRMLAAAVSHVRALEPLPDLVVVSGDLTDTGHPEEYLHLAELLEPLDLSLVLLPGNHDDPTALAEVFGRPEGAADAAIGWQQVVEVGPLRVVTLDTRVPGEPGGRLGPDRLAWLEEALGRSSAPTIVALHHPPFASGIQHMDGMALADADALGEVIERHRHVVRLITGHLHRNITLGWRGTVVTTCPSTAHQVALDLTGGPARWRREPPAVHLHVWLPHTATLVTHTSPIGDHGPAEPFTWTADSPT